MSSFICDESWTEKAKVWLRQTISFASVHAYSMKEPRNPCTWKCTFWEFAGTQHSHDGTFSSELQEATDLVLGYGITLLMIMNGFCSLTSWSVVFPQRHTFVSNLLCLSTVQIIREQRAITSRTTEMLAFPQKENVIDKPPIFLHSVVRAAIYSPANVAVAEDCIMSCGSPTSLSWVQN